MAETKKLELMITLSDKLFNNALTKMQMKLSVTTSKMEDKLQSFDKTQKSIFSKVGETLKTENLQKFADYTKELAGRLNFVNDINKTKVALQQMGAGNIDEVATKVHELGKIWGESDNEIANAANAMTKQIGGDFMTNLAIIEQGYQKGANLPGNMIANFSEFAPKMKELGMNAKEMMGVMAQAGNQHIEFGDVTKSLEKLQTNLDELDDKSLSKILSGVNLDANAVRDKTPFEAAKAIANAMKGASGGAKDAAAGLFGNEGADISFLEKLGSVEMNPDNIKSFNQVGGELTTTVSEMESSFADGIGSFMPWVNGLALVGTGISGFIALGGPLISLLGQMGIGTKLMAAAQWLLNIAMDANPIALIVLAIAALIGLVALAITYFDSWGAALLLFMGPIGMIISAFKLFYDHWDSIVKAFQTGGIIAGIKRIGMVLLDLLLKPVQQLLEILAKIPGLGHLAGKGAGYIEEMRKNMQLVTPGEEEAKVKTASQTPKVEPKSVENLAYKTQGLLATSDKNKNTKKTGENINKIAGEANQQRNISITIDALNKGGINVAPSEFKGMSLADVEAWFKETMMRVMLNAERA